MKFFFFFFKVAFFLPFVPQKKALFIFAGSWQILPPGLWLMLSRLAQVWIVVNQTALHTIRCAKLGPVLYSNPAFYFCATLFLSGLFCFLCLYENYSEGVTIVKEKQKYKGKQSTASGLGPTLFLTVLIRCCSSKEHVRIWRGSDRSGRRRKGATWRKSCLLCNCPVCLWMTSK